MLIMFTPVARQHLPIVHFDTSAGSIRHCLCVPQFQVAVSADAGERVRNAWREHCVVDELRMARKRTQGFHSIRIPQLYRSVPAGTQHQLLVARPRPIQTVNFRFVFLVADLWGDRKGRIGSL